MRPSLLTRQKSGKISIMNPTSAIVLAGGQSRRMGMGSDKAFVRLGDKPLIEIVLDQVAQLSDDLIVVTNAPQRYAGLKTQLIGDIYPGKGSLGGVYSGLVVARHPHALVVACDMPFLNLDLLRYMVSLVGDFDAVIPRAEDPSLTGARPSGTAKETSLHPLHAIYGKTCLGPMRAAIQAGDLRLVGYLPRVRVRYVSPDEVDQFDPQHLSFFNINTPDDLTRAARFLEGREFSP